MNAYVYVLVLGCSAAAGHCYGRTVVKAMAVVLEQRRSIGRWSI